MKRTKITVTEAARKFADCVNRARYQNMTFVLVKNGTEVAQLVPANEKVCTGSQAAEALAAVKLSRKEAQAWLRDIKAARKRLKPPKTAWE